MSPSVVVRKSLTLEKSASSNLSFGLSSGLFLRILIRYVLYLPNSSGPLLFLFGLVGLYFFPFFFRCGGSYLSLSIEINFPSASVIMGWALCNCVLGKTTVIVRVPGGVISSVHSC